MKKGEFKVLKRTRLRKISKENLWKKKQRKLRRDPIKNFYLDK